MARKASAGIGGPAYVGKTKNISQWIGMCFVGEPSWTITCPCGVVVNYRLNEIPTEAAKHPCSNPDHWSIRYEAAPACPSPT